MKKKVTSFRLHILLFSLAFPHFSQHPNIAQVFRPSILFNNGLCFLPFLFGRESRDLSHASLFGAANLRLILICYSNSSLAEKIFRFFFFGRILLLLALLLLRRWWKGNSSRRSSAHCIREAGVRVRVARSPMETRSFGISLALFMVNCSSCHRYLLSGEFLRVFIYFLLRNAFCILFLC